MRYPRLLEAAIDEFAMRRYEDASLNDILKKSGMSKGVCTITSVISLGFTWP